VSERGRRAGLLLVVALGLAGLAAGRVEAAVLRNVQTGEIAMSATTVTVGAAQGFLTAVDPARAFVVCSQRVDSNQATRRVACQLTSGTTLTLTTATADTGTVVRWSVVEFESGVRVQRGAATFVNTALTPAAQPTLSPAVDPTKSFVLTSERYDQGTATADERWLVRARLTSPTALTLDRNEGANGTTLTVAWQVVELQGASVQRGTLCIGAAATCPGSNGGSNTATLGTAVDTAKSFIVLTRTAGTAVGGIDNRYQVRADFGTTGSAVTGLTFTRAVTSTTANQQVDIAYEVVSLSDGSAVRRGSTTTSTGAATVTSGAFATVDLTRTAPLVTLSGGSGTGTGQLDETSWTSAVSATTLTFQRAATGTASTLAWQAVQFFRCVSNPLCTVSARTVSGAATVYWSPIFLDACGNTPCHALVLRAPTAVNTDAPVSGTAYVVGQTIGASRVVHDGSGATIAQSVADSGLTDGATYCYKVFAKTAATSYVNVSSSATCTATSEVKGIPQGAGVAWSHAVSGGSALGGVIPNFVDFPASLRVFGSSNGSRIFALDAITGAATSAANTHAPVQGWLSWLVDGTAAEVVVGGDQKAYVYALDPVTGIVRWSVMLPVENAADGLAAPVSAQIAQGASGDVLFVPTRNASDTRNRVFALRLTDGSVLWTFNGTFTRPMDIAIGQPYVDYARNRLWVTTRAGAAGTQSSLWILDSTTGALVQSLALGPVDAAPSLAYDGNTVYVGANGGTLYAIDAQALTIRWSSTVVSPASAIKGFAWEDFDLPGRLYFVTLDGNVYCVQDTGVAGTKCADWPVNPRKPVAAGTVSQPMIACPLGLAADNFSCAGALYALFVGGSDGRLYQLRTSDGLIDKQLVVGDGTKALGDLSSQSGAQLFVGNSDGQIYRIPLPLP
jgi:hypothetical protein